jgi:hypothetical protein
VQTFAIMISICTTGTAVQELKDLVQGLMRRFQLLNTSLSLHSMDDREVQSALAKLAATLNQNAEASADRHQQLEDVVHARMDRLHDSVDSLQATLKMAIMAMKPDGVQLDLVGGWVW